MYKREGIVNLNIFSDIVLVIIILINSIIITFLSLYFNKYYSKTNMIKMSKLIFLLNFAPIFGFFFVLFGLFKSFWLPFFILGIGLYILSLVNYFKCYYREEPLYVSDFKLFLESINMAGEYSIKLTIEMILVLVLVLLYTFVLSLIKLNLGLYNRILYSTIGIVFIYFIYSNKYFSLKKYYERSIGELSESTWSDSDKYQYHGFVYPLLYSINFLNMSTLYDTEKLYSKNILNKCDNGKVVSNRINFITLMLESFTYFGEYNIKWDKYPYKNFDLIMQNSYSGNLITNVFGGGTVDTENSYLTGFSKKLSNKKNYTSFVSHLQDNGYETIAMHPNNGWFYNRKKFYSNIGFNKFFDINDLSIQRKDALNDEVFFDAFLKICEENINMNNPLFAFGITFQNHGPYSNEKYNENEFVINNSNDKDINVFNNYITGIARTDKQLIKVFEFIEKIDKPIVLTVFGDHRPWLGYEGAGYTKLGIDANRNLVDGFINYYKTPYLIYGNNAAKDLTGREFLGYSDIYISPNMLMPTVYNYIGFNNNSYGNYLAKEISEISMICDKYLCLNNRFIKNDSMNEKYLYEYSIIENYWMNKEN